MQKDKTKILVTGGAGFIGSAFIRLLAGTVVPIAIIDKLTYAGDLARIKVALPNFKFYRTDICDKSGIEVIFQKERPDIVVHFAAETHVDRSIDNASPFIETNIKGTQVLLDVSRKYKVSKLIHISTDEVYGEIKNGKFSESSPIKPNSPYAASKAAADLLVQAYIRTYRFPAVIVRSCNNYGPWQFPEKLIPVAISTVLKGGKAPVYARGQNVREWLYVDDCAKGILKIMQNGRIGQVYNLGSGIESKNIDIVKLILKYLNVSPSRYKFVKDRPGHDLRYSLDCSKIKKELIWRPQVSFKEGLRFTVNWYLQHKPWLFK